MEDNKRNKWLSTYVLFIHERISCHHTDSVICMKYNKNLQQVYSRINSSAFYVYSRKHYEGK